jgi:MSHA pilin protein MshC
MVDSARKNRVRGFTFIELTVVLVVVGILAVVAMAKLAAVDRFAVQGFFESAKATARFAQKMAVAQRTSVVLVVSPNSIGVCYTDAGCGSPVTDPTTGKAMSITAPAGVSVAGSSQMFDGLGSATPGGTIIVSGAGTTYSLVVEAGTGYVHD